MLLKTNAKRGKEVVCWKWLMRMMPPPYMCLYEQCFFLGLRRNYKFLCLLFAPQWCVMGLRWGSHQMIPAEPWAPLLLIAPSGDGLNVENWCWLFKGLQFFGWMQRTESPQLGTQISWLHFKYLNLSRLAKRSGEETAGWGSQIQLLQTSEGTRKVKWRWGKW